MIRNVHCREVPVPVSEVGPLLDGILEADSIWPSAGWPALRLDHGLAVGSSGGHGPIRYRVTDHQPGKRLEFAFDPSMGVEGTHALELHAGARPGSTLVRHTLIGRPTAATRLRWAFAIRWLHDALIEDLLDNVAVAAGHPPAKPARWSPWVRLLRRAVGRRRATSARPQPTRL
ncbi:hypothetical protein [Flindersiella endophytica]